MSNPAELEILVKTVFQQIGKPFGKEDVDRVVGSLRSAAPAAAAAGAHVGEKAGEGMSHALEHHLKVHVANMIGNVLGAPGVGRLAALGAGGVIGAVGLAATEKIGEAISEKLKELKEEYAALGELGKTLHATHSFEPGYLDELKEVAENMHVAGINTTEWLGTLKELHSHGANAENIRPYMATVKTLTELLGNDAKTATKVWTSALDGNTDALRSLGIVVDAALRPEEQLAEITHQLALRTAAFGESAVIAGPQVRALKEAGESAAEGLAAIKREAEEADRALSDLLKKIGEANASRQKHASDTADQKTAETNRDFAAGKITGAQRDDALAAIEKEKREAKFNADKNALTAEKALHEQRAQQAQKEITDRRAEGDAADEQLNRSQAWEEKAAEAAKLRAEADASRGTARLKLQKGQVYPWGNDDPDFPEKQAKAAEEAAEKAKSKAFGITSAQAAEKLNSIYGPDGNAMRAANDKAHEVARKNAEEAAAVDDKLRDLEDHHAHEEATKQIEAATKRIELRKQLDKQFEDYKKSAAQARQHGKEIPVPDDLKGYMGPDGKFHPPDLFPEPAQPKAKRRAPVFQYPSDFDPGESEPVAKNQHWNEEQRRLRERNMRLQFERNQSPQEHFDSEGGSRSPGHANTQRATKALEAGFEKVLASIERIATQAGRRADAVSGAARSQNANL